MMAVNVILPALGMSQDTGKIVQWLKAKGERVTKGEPLAEVETDKATVEIEAPADGILAHISAAVGDNIPVGHVIAAILAPEETLNGNETQGQAQQHSPVNSAQKTGSRAEQAISAGSGTMPQGGPVFQPQAETTNQVVIIASALAARIAAEHKLDLSRVQPKGERIQKSDVLRYLQQQSSVVPEKVTPRLIMASPKARRLAVEQGKDLAKIKGSGPGGAVLAADVLNTVAILPLEATGLLSSQGSIDRVRQTTDLPPGHDQVVHVDDVSNIWRIMAEHTTQSWTHVPHFYLVREVNASRLIDWRERLLKLSTEKVTYTDLLVKIVATALRQHPRLNISWNEGKLIRKQGIHIGLAMALEEGLVVPVIHQADVLGLNEIARQRRELMTKAQRGKLRPSDISDGTFTISNLGMYGVDAFNAIINQPQAAILAVGRIAERVVPVRGQPVVQPMMVLTLTCDHRAVDGARGAQFLATLTEMIEEPLALFADIILKGGSERDR
jgi:pyruvate dehydrogenase E2 component (dihydrolipoamide acetyltransferase)